MLPCTEGSCPCFFVQKAAVRASLYRRQLSVLPCTEGSCQCFLVQREVVRASLYRGQNARHAGVWGPAWHGQSTKAIQVGTKSAVMSPWSEDGALLVALQAIHLVVRRRAVLGGPHGLATPPDHRHGFLEADLIHDPSLAFRHPSLKLCRSWLRC